MKQLEIAQMGFEEAYNVYKSYKDNLPIDDVILIKRVIRKGVNIFFDARLMFINAVEEHPKREVIVIGKKRFTMTDFMDEMELRETELKKILIKNLAEDNAYVPYSKEDKLLN